MALVVSRNRNDARTILEVYMKQKSLASTEVNTYEMTPAEYCNYHKYGVGTRLIGDEGRGPTIIEITAIGKEKILAKVISYNGVADPSEYESTWIFFCRDWKPV